MKEIYLPNGTIHYVPPDSRVIFDRPAPLRETLDQKIARMKEWQNLMAEEEHWQDETEVSVRTPAPFFYLMPLADLHLGDMGTNYDEVRERLAFLRDYPVATILVGNIGNFFLPARYSEGMITQAPIDWQMSLMKKFFEEYNDKILAVVSAPCHEEWLYQVAGIDINRWLTEDLGIPLLNSGGKLKLKINEQEYNGIVFHRIKGFNSQLNPTHAGKQAARIHGEADFIIDAHTHQGATEKTRIRGKPVMIVRCGTTKTEDRYGTRQGYLGRPYSFYPILFFCSDRKNIEAVEDIQTAREIIEAIDAITRMTAVSFLKK